MPHYLVTIHHPDTYVPSLEDEAMVQDISALNQEMIAAGVRTWACGLASASLAKALRPQPDGTVGVTDGPYLPGTEHAGGFWILETADMDQALTWADKAVRACRTAVEVRAILFRPTAS